METYMQYKFSQFIPGSFIAHIEHIFLYICTVWKYIFQLQNKSKVGI